jgi:PAS domain S-box-containing protein
MGILQIVKRWLFSSRPEKVIPKLQAHSSDHDPTTEKLRQSEERFQVLVDSIQDYAIYILDPDGFVVSWNTGAERIKGYRANEIVGKHFSRFYTPDDLRNNKPKRNLEIAATEGRYEDESLRLRKDGSVFWANVLITAIHDLSGNLTGFAKVVRDITERKASEQRMNETERLATLGTTAAIFAHEIANPLNGLSTSLQIMTDLVNESGYKIPLLTETLEGAHQEIQRLTMLLGDYRSLARPQALKIEETNLRRIIEEVLAPNRKSYEAAGVTVGIHFDEILPLLPLDAAKTKQVILNLCKNAVEAMPNGGALTLKGYRTNDRFVLEVSDTGEGIPEDFDPFHLFKSSKPEGTGLGLPIVQQIISDHHGTVDYVSDVGKGTTFKLSFPL